MVTTAGLSHSSYNLANAPTQVSENKVQSPSAAYRRMEANGWTLITALLGGTPAMRECGEDYLPRPQIEVIGQWEKRRSMSFLYPGFSRAVERIVAKAMSRRVYIQAEDKLPARMKDVARNVDGRGTTLHQLAGETLRYGLHRGLMHVAVDFPGGIAPDRGTEVLRRPRMIAIDPTCVIAAPYEITDEGVEQLAQVRILESATERDGSFGMRETQQVRVWNADGTWAVYRRPATDGGDEWPRHGAGGKLTIGVIPLATGYLDRLGFFEGASPLAPVAWLNLQHWQRASRHDWYLDFAQTGFYFGSGWTKPEVDKGVTVDPGTVKATTNPQATLTVVEHQGKAAEIGYKALERLEQAMDQAGLAPLAQKQIATAAHRMLDESSSITEAREWVNECEITMTEALRFYARWLNETLDPDVAVRIPSSMEIPRALGGGTAAIEKAVEIHALDKRTYLKELQARGELSEESNIEEILDAAGEEEAEALAQLAEAMPKAPGAAGGDGEDGPPDREEADAA